MKKAISVITVLSILIALLSVMVLVGETALAVDESGTLSNWNPYNTTQIDSDKGEYDNSGSDVLTLTCTLRDNNTEAEFEHNADEDHQLIIYREATTDDDGFTPGGGTPDVIVATYESSATQVASKVWFDDNGGATNGSDNDGTTSDGYIEIEDENDDDDNFEMTVGAWTVGHYSAQLNYTDDQGSAVTTFVLDGFDIATSITYSVWQADGNTAGASFNLGNWTANPDTLRAPIDMNATGIIWLLVNNTGSDPVQSWTFSFGGATFTGDSWAETIPIDSNIIFVNFTSTVAPGACNPQSVDVFNYTAVDADGDYTFTFGALGEKHWVQIEIQDIATDDVIRDDIYRESYTVSS